MAVSAAKFQSVTGFRGPVTAEVASSSLVVPASFFQGIIGRDTRKSNPQFNPQLTAPPPA
jgi:hypothetical protein